MRAIIKGREPTSLKEHRLTPHCDYDNYAHKADLRRALVTEQQGLCCYCMGRIRADPQSMKIEHWQCQSRFPDHQLVYRNLLGACGGGDGRPWQEQHCDTRKGDRDMLWNPAEPGHRIEERIRYELDGSIHSDDPIFDDQLDEVLNLNFKKLKNNRKSILDAVLHWWKAERARLQGPVPRDRLRREVDRRRVRVGELMPYCQVAIWWLQQRLSRTS